MKESAYLESVQKELRAIKGLADKAISQVGDEDFFRQIDPESNSIAIIVKHLAGSMQSRWQDFLTTDGEKLDRVIGAINRQLAHIGNHVGQVAFLAKHYAGARWQALTVPRNKNRRPLQ